MKAALLAVAIVSSILIATSLYNASTNYVASSDNEIAFNQWMMKYGKSYEITCSTFKFIFGLVATNVASKTFL